jgi:thioredoxin-dependent peroxiredoxin
MSAIRIFLAASLSLSLFGYGGAVKAGGLQVGAAAPDFTLGDQHGREHRLSDYQGRWVVLYFYPKNDTPGCTEEACRFRDDIAYFNSISAQVFGVSLDSVESHAAFAEKHGLPFPLLSDAGGTTAQAYGSLRNFGLFRLAQRHTFIIDPAGRIAKIYRKVSPSTHSAEVIEDLTNLLREHSTGS